MASWWTMAVILATIWPDMANAHEAVPVSNCDGFVSPPGCTKGVNCAFEAYWTVSNLNSSMPSGDATVTFNVTIRRAADKASNFYTAVGFSEYQAMPDTDVVIGYAFNNNFLEVVDGYISPGAMAPPVVDQLQNVFNSIGSLVDDPADRTKRILSFSFTRKLDTGDKSQDHSLTACRYFFFMTSGGSVTGPRTFAKHDVTPDMSAAKICLTQCSPSSSDASIVQNPLSISLIAFSLLIFLFPRW